MLGSRRVTPVRPGGSRHVRWHQDKQYDPRARKDATTPCRWCVVGASPRVDLERGWAIARATANPGVVVAADICRWLDGNHGLGAADWWCRGEDKRDKSACSTATYQDGRSPAGVDQGGWLRLPKTTNHTARTPLLHDPRSRG